MIVPPLHTHSGTYTEQEPFRFTHGGAGIEPMRCRFRSTGMTAELHSRRTVLTTGAAVAGAAVGAAALTACGSSSSNSATGGAPAPIAAGTPLVALADVPVGEAKAAKAPDGSDVIVSRTSESAVAAFSAICTHQGCTVTPKGADLVCPCHNSVFNALTGEVKQGPANKPLPAVQVKVENGQVVTG
jgi:Rieske Fe-S protein